MNKSTKVALLCAIMWTAGAMFTSIATRISGIPVNDYQLATIVLQWACAAIWWCNFLTRKGKE